MKKKLKNAAVGVVALALGLGLGIGLGALGDYLGMELKGLFFLCLFLSLVLGTYLCLILHEGGHMVGGLLSGYRFVSFRIGSLMLIRDREGFRLKRFTLAGTGGQCLMDPPEMVNGDFPFLIYNMSGFFVNLLCAALCAGICLFVRPKGYLMLVLVLFGVESLYLGLINGIPLSIGGMDNDGKNNVTMKKSAFVRRCLWIQLRGNAELVRGTRLREMPEEWFTFPEKEDWSDALSAAWGVMAFSRMIDEMEFEKATVFGERLLREGTGLLEIHRLGLQAELMFLELVGEQRPEKLELYEKKEFQKFLIMTKKYLSTIRLQYAYALLFKKDEEKAAKLKTDFEKAARVYPNAGDIVSERELMACVEKLSEKNKNPLDREAAPSV